jgi:hypothetical protein
MLRRIKRGGIDILLCMSVDRISRDMEHSSSILKQLRHYGVELWTVQNKTPVTDMELGLRSIINHDQIEQTRYKTREGMKTSIKKGKAAGGIAYGYRIKLIYDDRGDRIPGVREVDEEQANIVRWIFEQYGLGRSPSEMAVELNNRIPPVAGPRGLRWRDTAIRGSKERGTGILNNETYIGRLVFNRRKFSKNPDTEQREARMKCRRSGSWTMNSGRRSSSVRSRSRHASATRPTIASTGRIGHPIFSAACWNVAFAQVPTPSWRRIAMAVRSDRRNCPSNIWAISYARTQKPSAATNWKAACSILSRPTFCPSKARRPFRTRSTRS